MELTFRHCVPHTAMMIRSSVLRENNIKYESQFSPCEDYMICLRLINYTIFHNLMHLQLALLEVVVDVKV